MTSRVLALVAPFLVLAAACGGDGESSHRQPLAPPPVSPNLTVIGQGSIALEIGGRAAQAIDPASLLRESGETTACERLVVLFSWRTSEGRSIDFTARRQQDDVKVGEGKEGVASVSGCGVISANNSTNNAIRGELRYVLAQTP